MPLFSRKQRTGRSGQWSPPSGLVTTPQRLVRTVPFVFDPSGQPAFSHQQLVDLDKGGDFVDLDKGYNAAAEALAHRKLKGLRLRVIVIVDGSGSMRGEYSRRQVQKMLVRTLGFTLNVVPKRPNEREPQIPVFVYGYGVSGPVMVGPSNYEQAPSLIRPDFGTTAMTEAFDAAMALADSYEMLTVIINITDGNPNNKITMSNSVIGSSGKPVMLKNLAVKKVSYLEEIDNLPSQYEIDLNPDESPRLDADGNLIIVHNPNGIRLIDNVDSQEIDPYSATEQQFAAALAEEIGTCVEVMGRVGHLTGVPGITRTF